MKAPSLSGCARCRDALALWRVASGLFVLVACGNVEKSRSAEPASCPLPEAGAKPISFESLPRELAITYCRKLFECPLASRDLQLNRAAFENVDGCAEVYERFVRASASFVDLATLLTEGRIGYQPACARGVLDRIESSCSAGLYHTISSRDVVPRWLTTGTVAPGGPCRRDEECAGDAYCQASAECGGTCSLRKITGLACERPGECSGEPGTLAFCDGACWVGSPLDALAGEACSAASECDLAGCSGACAPGLFCDASGCASPGVSGAPCSEPRPCEAGNVCIGDMCRPLQFVGAAESCVPELDATPDPLSGAIQYCNPYENVHCVAGRCEPLSDGTADSPCRESVFASGDLTRLCNEGLACDPGQRACAPLRAAAESCDFDSDCATTTCNSGTCSEHYCQP